MNTNWRKLLPLLIIIALAAAIFIYFIFAHRGGGGSGSTASAPAENPPIPVPNYPIPASSYGKEAKGGTGAAAGGLVLPEPTDKVGIIEGAAKPAAGATPKLSSVKISLSDPKTGKELADVNLAADGSYKFIVEPGEYVVNVVKGTGSSAQLPQRVYVGGNETIEVNFFLK